MGRFNFQLPRLLLRFNPFRKKCCLKNDIQIVFFQPERKKTIIVVEVAHPLRKRLGGPSLVTTTTYARWGRVDRIVFLLMRKWGGGLRSEPAPPPPSPLEREPQDGL